MKYKLISIILLLGLSICSEFVNNGSWLEIIPDSRAAAMGGANTAIASSAYAIYWNPALLHNQHNAQVSFIDLREGQLNYLSMAYAFPLANNTFGISVYYLASGAIEETIYQSGRPLQIGTMPGLTYLLVSVGFSTNLSGFQIGITEKILSQTLANERSTGIGVDAGIFYPMDSIVLGASHAIIPIRTKWTTETKETLQGHTRAGVGCQIVQDLIMELDMN